MDDQNFSQEDAAEWIRLIEAVKVSTRENDIYRMLSEWVNQLQDSEVLEIGCGQGICSEHLDLIHHNYTGIDPSPFLIERALQLYSTKNRRFTLANTYALPFADQKFAGAFSVSVWHLLANLNQAAKELKRILKSNGRFLIITANPSSYSNWTSLYAESTLQGKRFEGKLQNGLYDVLHLHSLDEIKASLTLAELQIENLITFRNTPNNQHLYLAVYGKSLKLIGYRN